MHGCENRDEKLIIQAFKGTEFEAADRVIKRGSWDRSLLIVAEGKLLVFDDQGENMLLESGAILGIEQFLFNKQWESDIFC